MKAPKQLCPAVDEDGPCGRSPEVGELCRKHYTRRRRHNSFSGRQPKVVGNGFPVSFTLEDSDRIRLDKLAEREGVSLGTLLRRAVRSFLEKANC
jgi:hypothetical protein